MKLIILLLICSSLHAQWKEDGRTQVWPATIHLRDSINGKQWAIKGYVVKASRRYYENGKLKPGLDPDWTNVIKILDANHKPISWRMYDYYEAIDPTTGKVHMK